MYDLYNTFDCNLGQSYVNINASRYSEYDNTGKYFLVEYENGTTKQYKFSNGIQNIRYDYGILEEQALFITFVQYKELFQSFNNTKIGINIGRITNRIFKKYINYNNRRHQVVE